MGVGAAIGLRIMRLVTLHLQVIVLAKQLLEPKHRRFRLLYLSFHDQLRDLTAQAGGADDQILVVFFQQLLVDARATIEPFRPREGDHLNQVLVPIHILGQHNQVPSTTVVLRGQFAMATVACAIALTA